MDLPIRIVRIHDPEQLSGGDLRQINDLLATLSPGEEHHFDAVHLVEMLRLGAEVLAVRHVIDDRKRPIVGMITLVQVPKAKAFWHGEIQDLVVVKEYQGRGIGRALMEQAIRSARVNTRLSHLFLTSRPARKRANQLYRSLGFKLSAAARKDGTNLYYLNLREEAA